MKAWQKEGKEERSGMRERKLQITHEITKGRTRKIINTLLTIMIITVIITIMLIIIHATTIMTVMVMGMIMTMKSIIAIAIPMIIK